MLSFYNYSLIFLFALIGLSCNSVDKQQDAPLNTSTIKRPDFDKLPIRFTSYATCQRACYKIKSASLKKFMKSAKARTKQKWYNAKPCPFFIFESQADTNYKMIAAACDSMLKVVKFIPNKKPKKKCNCVSRPKKRQEDKQRSEATKPN